jgi:hypothetical protein
LLAFSGARKSELGYDCVCSMNLWLKTIALRDFSL